MQRLVLAGLLLVLVLEACWRMMGLVPALLLVLPVLLLAARDAAGDAVCPLSRHVAIQRLFHQVVGAACVAKQRLLWRTLSNNR